MPDMKKILELIFEAVGELNERLPEEEWLEKSKDTPLTGESATLDSLKLVSLIVATEQKVQEELNAIITIASERRSLHCEKGHGVARGHRTRRGKYG